jgi:DnaK suppressor protein
VAQKKKTTNKKTNKADKNRLTEADLENFKQLLLEKRREIVGSVNEMEDEAIKKSSGDLSNVPIHMADQGSDNFEQEFALGLMDSERKILRQIDVALQHMAENDYGICEKGGEQIAKARLEAEPWTRYCVDCARSLEKSRAQERTRGVFELPEDEIGNEQETS